MRRLVPLLAISRAQQLVYKYNVSCDNATNTLVKDERRDPATGEWVGEWVEPGGGWVPNYVRINLRARYIHEMGGDNSSKLAKQLCHEIGATIATIYSKEEDELAYAACKPADCWIGLEEDGGIPDYLCDGKCGTAETWWGEQVRSRRPAVLRCLHAIDATRLHERRRWVVSFSILSAFHTGASAARCGRIWLLCWIN